MNGLIGCQIKLAIEENITIDSINQQFTLQVQKEELIARSNITPPVMCYQSRSN